MAGGKLEFGAGLVAMRACARLVRLVFPGG